MTQYTREQIFDAMRAADAAGDGESVRRLTEYLQTQQVPPSVAIGRGIRDVPRQVGLTGRYALEAGGQIANIVTEPIRQIVVNPILRAFDLPEGRSMSAEAARLADAIGLPPPQTPDERVIGDATRTGFSAIGMGGLAQAGSKTATGVARNVLKQLSSRMGLQGASAAGAGAAGGAVREAGGGPLEQFAAALLGGLSVGVAANKATNAANTVAKLVRQMAIPKAEQVKTADQAIDLILQRSGVDWRAVPEGIKAGLRSEVAQSLNTGQPLNADAVRRLLVFRRTGTTPTVGMLTQRPGQITREQNLAKTGANSTDEALQRLPEIYNQNIAQLLRQLDDAGAAAAANAESTGATAISGLEARARGARSRIDALYDAARDSSGRSLPLDGGAFTARANRLLDEAMVGGELPAGVAEKLNLIATGKIPLTVEIAEQLKTRIGNLQRGNPNGSARMALGLVRQALDETPLFNPRVNPGNVPAVPSTVPPSTQQVGEQAIRAFNRARAANRAYMQTLEANPALSAVDDAIAALRSNRQLRSVNDIVGNGQFVAKFVISKSATPGEVNSLLRQVGPNGAKALRQYVVRYLRETATQSTDDVAKFSNAAYRKALRDIGDEKLAALFTRQEVDQLRAIGDAAKYIQAQPAGSAVNNSNSGALVIGRGLDMLDRIAGYVPLGGRDVIRGKVQGVQQSIVLDPRNALTAFVPPPRVPFRVNPLVAVTVPTPVDGREDDRRRQPP